MDKLHNYIICMYDDNLEIHGPFATASALLKYGRKWQKKNCDRPTWQSIYLDDPHARVKFVVVPPKER
jgi:hypothetical protein